jgi:hypothetical protein
VVAGNPSKAINGDGGRVSSNDSVSSSIAVTEPSCTIADADARENWEMMIAWRDHLVKHRTLEAAYLEIIRRNIKFSHILMGQFPLRA